MRRRDLLATIGLLIVALVSAPLSAQQLDNLVIQDAWVPPMPGAAKTAAVYLTVVNRGTSPDRIVGAESPAAQRADLHTTIRDGDVMRMRHVVSVEVPAGGKVVFSPNGFHIMLTGLTTPLKMGDAVPITLKLGNGGEVTALATVRR